MMDNRALARVDPWFGPLLQIHSFEIVEAHDSATFGDSFAVAEGAHFRLRFVIDRDQTFVEIAASAKPERWHDLSLVNKLIEGPSAKASVEIPGLAAFVEENLSS